MKFVHIKEETTKDIALIPFGDLHYGSKDCDVQKIKDTIKWIKKKDNTRVVLMGDLIDVGLRDSIGGGTFDNDVEPEQQINDIIDMLMPIKDKIWCLLTGNHESVSKNTDILTVNGWKNVQKITENDLVGQFDIKTGKVSFDKPIDLIKHYSKELYRIEGSKTLQEVTSNHELVIDNKKIKAKDIKNNNIHESRLFLSGDYDSSCGFTEEDIKLLTWVVMDGTVVDYKKYNPKSKKVRIQFKLSKQKKIKELRKLLDSLDITYTFKEATISGCNKLQPYYIRIYGDVARRIWYLLNKKKQIPLSFKDMNKKELYTFLDVLEQTDGYIKEGTLTWSSISKHNIDVVQQACICHNVPFKWKLYEHTSGFNNGKPLYKSFINRWNMKLKNLKITKKPYDDYTYCFVMPKETLITRLEGKVAFTGNSRVRIRTSIDVSKLIANALNIRYCGDSCFIKAKVGSKNYVIFAAHGRSGALTPSGKLNAIMKYGSYIDADLYIAGHVHELMHHTTDYFRVDLKDKMVIKDKRHYVITGHFLHYGGYAEQKGYSPGKSGVAKILLSSTKKGIHVSI